MLLTIVVESILKLFMIRSLFTILATIFRAILALVLIADLILVAFVGYKGSQPMQQVGANGMTYLQFMRDRIGAIHAQPAKCQQMHLTAYLLAVPIYPVLYTYVGMFPNSIWRSIPSRIRPFRKMCA